MKLRRSLALLGAVFCAALITLAACSSSQKSAGKRTVIMEASDEEVAAEQQAERRKRTVLLTEADDARIGDEVAKQVAAEIGIIKDPDLEAYVQGLGEKLLRGLPRRSFKYRFSIVDQFEPNAFALPGGHIFISRGLLAMVNDEDELANVIGHEITHSAKRHAAVQQQLAKQQNPLLMGLMRVGKMASYQRDMERDADRGGQHLAAAAGYNPRGMSTFLGSLEQRERLLLGHPRAPTFFDTHPTSTERAAANAVRASEIRWTRDPGLGDTRASHLRQVDGLSLGERPEAGLFEGQRFFHPELHFEIRFPQGWRTSNTNRAVGAEAPRGNALIVLEADRPLGDPQTVAAEFVEENQEKYGLRVKESRPIKLGEIDAWRIHSELTNRAGALDAYVAFIPFREATLTITGVAPTFIARNYEGRILNTIRSFRPLRADEMKQIEATRLRVVKADPGEDITTLSRRTNNVWNRAGTAVGNGVLPSHRFKGGELVKIARTEPWMSGAR
jgi:predicted Zn-dependent protease